MQRLMITGGLGFIGSNFIHLLAELDAPPAVLNVDLLTYAGNPLNLEPLDGLADYELIIGDIADREHMASVMAEFKPDALINFAAESMVDRSITGAAPFIHSNIAGTQVLLDLAREHSVARFLQVSTDEVYGSLGPAGEFTEDSPLAPNNPYAASKAAADLLCRSYFVTHGFPVLTTRCSNNYGPRQFPEKLIPLMIAKALNDEPLPVYGDGLHVRDWLHVSDHCRALLRVLEAGTPGRVYNIGGGQELPNLELVKLLLSHLGKPESLISHVPDRPGHDRRYAISYDRLQGELGWEPAVEFADGIRTTIDWYLANGQWLAAIKDGSYQQGFTTD